MSAKLDRLLFRFVGIPAIATLGVLFVWWHVAPAHHLPPAGDQAPAVELDELCRAYAGNPVAADKAYRGRWLRLSATPWRIAARPDGTVAVMVSRRPLVGDAPVVGCNLDRRHEAENIVTQRSYTVTGLCRGLVNELVVLDHCRFTPEGDS